MSAGLLSSWWGSADVSVPMARVTFGWCEASSPPSPPARHRCSLLWSPKASGGCSSLGARASPFAWPRNSRRGWSTGTPACQGLQLHPITPRDNRAIPKCLHSPCQAQQKAELHWQSLVLLRSVQSHPVPRCVRASSCGFARGKVSCAGTAAPWEVWHVAGSPNRRNASSPSSLECRGGCPSCSHPSGIPITHTPSVGVGGRWVWQQQHAAPLAVHGARSQNAARVESPAQGRANAAG